MVACFEFADAEGVLRLTLSGEMTDQAVMEIWSKGKAFVSSFVSARSIVDLSGVTRFDVSTQAITMLARSSSSPNHPSRVFVAPKDALYGTARMFQVLSERTRKNVHVVRTMEEAYKLLGIGSPEFRALTAIELDN